jgi:hypothetical protein
MKTASFIISIVMSFLLLSACNNSGKNNAADLPKAGTVIDSVSEPVLEDKLNNFRNTIVITADSSIQDGVYDIKTEFENNVADGKFTMPRGLPHYTIKLRKDAAPYTYLIGFYLPKDTTFHKYLEVKALKTTISMKYVKSYSFE